MAAPELLPLMNREITVKRVVSLSASGAETLGDARVFRAYVEKRTQTRNAGANAPQERRQFTFVMTDGVNVADPERHEQDSLTLDDRVWLPEATDVDDVKYSRRPVSVDSYDDPLTGALSHFEARF